MDNLIILVANNYPFFIISLGIFMLPRPKDIKFIIDAKRIQNAAFIALVNKIIYILGIWSVDMHFSVRWFIITSMIGYILRPFIMYQIAAGMESNHINNRSLIIPAVINALIMSTALFSNISFTYDENLVFYRGPLGFSPHITCLLYFCYYVLLQIHISHTTQWKQDNIIVIIFSFAALIASLLETFYLATDVLDTTINIAALCTYVYTYIQYTNRDPLTFLFNRQAYYEYISGNANKITGVISVDMNGLKTINDRMGHDAGDKALIQIGQALQKMNRHNIRMYRMGGDEFTVICTKYDPESIVNIVDDIKHELKNITYSCSIGYAIQNGEKSIDDLNKEADKNMYIEKQHYYTLHERRR